MNPLDVACLENDVKIEAYEEKTVVSNGCETSADCLDEYNWFCAEGVCEHRCLENGVCSREAFFNYYENEVQSNDAVKKCATFDDCDDPYNWFCDIEPGQEEGECVHRCLTGNVRCAMKKLFAK